MICGQFAAVSSRTKSGLVLRWTQAALCSAVLCVLASGCRSDTSTGEVDPVEVSEASQPDAKSTGSSVADETEESATDKNVVSPAAPADVEPSPLEKLLGGHFASMTEEEFQVFRAETNLRIEEEKQSCMAEEGWEYELFPVEEMERMAGVPVVGNKPGYGYYESVEFALWFNDSEKVEAAIADQPNRTYVESLPEADREQWGNTEAACGMAAVDLYQPERKAVSSSDPGFDLDEQRELLERKIANDPRVAEAWLAWSRCMAAEGFDFQDRESIFGRLDEEVAIFDEVISRGDTELSTDLAERLVALTDKEVAIKVADQSCSTPVTETERLVRVELEEAFIKKFGLKSDT